MRKQLLFIVTCFIVTMHVHSQGRVGINTTSPQALLHVKDSNVLFSAGTTLPGAPGTPPFTSVGVRMMWYPDKAAFRAGRVTSSKPTYSDKDSIGIVSFGVGNDVKAKGQYAIALGDNAEANGVQSAAIGTFVLANGNSSFAAGLFTEANGARSVTFGIHTLAKEQQSMAIGEETTAEGRNTFSMGESTLAIGQNSIAGGLGTVSIEDQSLVTGSYNDTSQESTFRRLFAIGNGNGSSFPRSNALTVLLGGEVGIGTSKPLHRLHVSNNNSQDGGWAEGIMIENTNASGSGGEAGLSFRNTNIPADKQWIIGVNQAPGLAFNYGAAFSGSTNSTRMMIDTLGNIGIGTITPVARFHVVSNNAAAGGTAEGILVENINATTGEAAVSFRNAGSSGSGAKQWMIGMDQTRNFSWGYGTIFDASAFRMVLDSAGNLGIGISTPDEKLDVAGNIKFSGELNRPSTGSANLVPICFGSVSATGSYQSGSTNFTIAHTGVGKYEITIAGEAYGFTTYTAIVSATTSGTCRTGTVAAVGTDLLISIWDPNGNSADCGFNFIVHKH